MTESTPTVIEEPRLDDKFRGVEISALVMQRRFVWPNRGDLSLSVSINATADHQTLDELADMLSHIADREELKAERAERMRALQILRDQPRQMRKEIDRLMRDRAAWSAGQQAERLVSRRTPLDPERDKKYKAGLEQFENQIRNAEQNIANSARDIKICEWEVTCFDARIAGAELPTPPPELDAAIEELRSAA